MTLELSEFTVDTLRLGDETVLDGTALTVSPADVREVVLADERIADVDVSVALPGDGTRINRVLDVIEPRAKRDGGGDTFPGVATGEATCGTGATLALSGIAIVASATLAHDGQTFVQEDCLIDTSGPGAKLTPFAKTANLVVRYDAANPDDALATSAAIREADVRLARALAHCPKRGAQERARHIAPRAVATPGDRPRVVYVCSVISEGYLHDTLLYGETTEHLEPAWIEPTEFLDGALVSSDFHYACQRVPTYLYQNNPVVEALLARDGDDLEFVGVIVTVRYGTDDRKLEAAGVIASMAAERGATAVVTHPAVGGNAQLDALYIVQESARKGLATSMMVQEMAGPGGEDLGLVDFVPEADLLISTGNRDEIVRLSAPGRVVGGDSLLDGDSAAGPIEVPMRLLCCSTTQVGALAVTGVAV